MGKTKALISLAVTVKLICVFVFAYMQKAGFLTTRLKVEQGCLTLMLGIENANSNDLSDCSFKSIQIC